MPLETTDAQQQVHERALVDRARDGDHDAFEALCITWLPRVHAFAWRRSRSVEVAQDVTQATFEKALRSLASFRWRAGGFGAWLYRIASNELSDHYRREGRPWTRRGRDAAARLAPVAISVDEVVESAVDAAEVLAALGSLRPRHQRAIALRYFADLSVAEVAEVMGTTENAMGVTLHRALKALRTALGEKAS